MCFAIGGRSIAKRYVYPDVDLIDLEREGVDVPNGALDITSYPNSSLGSDPSMLLQLRQGALEGVMAEAVAAAAGLPAADIRRAATFAGGIAPVARAALAEGAAGLQRFSIRLMQPVLPMLAQPAADVEAALAQLGDALLEWKLDGARVQVHKSGDEVRVFTRSLNEVTAAVPEIRDALKNTKEKSLILDGEAIALRADGKPQPFQVTMRRFGRKLDDEATRRELPLSVFFFD